MLATRQASRQVAAMLRAMILAVSGWLLLAAQSPQPKAEPQQKQPAAKVEAAPQGGRLPTETARPLLVEKVVQPADPAGYQDPCKGTQDDQRSDLCAQWTAANAARDAADYAGWQLGAAALGMVGLMVTIWLTFRAVRAAWESLAHSRAISRLELRPWLTLEMEATSDAKMIETGFYFDIKVVVGNVGKTPARDVRVTIDTFNVLRRLGGAPEHFLEETLKEAKSGPVAGFVAVPNEKVIRDDGITAWREDFGSTERDSDEGESDRPFIPMIVISATYRSTTDSKFVGQTAKGYIVEKVRPGGTKGGFGGADNFVTRQNLHIRDANAIGRAT